MNLLIFIVSLITSVNAETIILNSGFEVNALLNKEDEMSCRHLKLRTGQTELNLEQFADALPKLSQAEIQEQLLPFLRQRNGYPSNYLLREPVYRLIFKLKEKQILKVVESSQSTALWGVGFFEHQHPNGQFEQIHYKVKPLQEALKAIEFDVRAADVCIARRFDIVFFSDCPLETIRFEEWESNSFVTEWWKCKDSTTLSFNLAQAALSLGRIE